MKLRLLVLTIFSLIVMTLLGATSELKIKKGEWNGCEMHSFTIEGREGIVIIPDTPLEGNPWVWRPAFFGAFPGIDEELLKNGFHIAYYDNTYEWGRPESIESGQKFYEAVTRRYDLMPKAVMYGLSRGGYYSLRRAQLYPETVACLILDNPLVDIFELQRNKEWWSDVIDKWHIHENPPMRGEFLENALNNLHIPAINRIPVLLLSGDTDTIVPYENNGRHIVEVYRRYNAPVKSIVRPGAGHHPHGLVNPAAVIPFVKSTVAGQTDERHPVKVACLGNSITAGLGTSDMATKAYPAVLQRLLGDDYEVRNFGVSGATALRKGTDSGRPYWYGLFGECRAAVDFNPDIVILKLGGNDSKGFNWQYGEEFATDYQELIDMFKYLPSLPKIYLCLPAKARVDDPEKIWGINERVILEEITPIVREAARNNRLPTIDLHDVYDGEESICYSDNIHPTDRGAELIARRIYEVITRGESKRE